MIPAKTAAVLLKVTDYGESDKIATFYCRTSGKLSCIAKGAKRSKKRFLNKLEIFSLLDIAYVANGRSSLARIDQAELLNPFPLLRKNYDRFTAASLLCELVLHWTKENDSDEALFNLLAWALEELNTGRPTTGTVVLFQIKLFGLLGYKPHLAGCLGCGQLDREGEPYRFHTMKGGIVCKKCNNSPKPPRFPLSISTVKLLQKAQDLPHTKLGRLQFSSNSTEEALSLLKRYGSHLLQRDIHSWNFLQSGKAGSD